MNPAAASDTHSTSTALTIAGLRCEMQQDPVNIETTAPRLSWILESPVRGQTQQARHILAATSPAKLQPGKADLWDSGRIESDQSIHVEYAGKPLQSNQLVYWTVKAWDKHDQPSDWASPAKWGMALLSPAEWKAKWIGRGTTDAQVIAPIHTASWIWGGSAHTDSGEPAAAPAEEIRQFRKVFSIEEKVTSAVLTFSADNKGRAWLNGQLVGDSGEWEHPVRLPAEKHLQPGMLNTLLIEAWNGGSRPNPAGMIAVLSMNYADGTTTEIVTDAQWTISPPRTAREPGVKPADVAGWESCRVVAAWGGKPWNNASIEPVVRPRPIFRGEFNVSKPVQRAVVHICGLGHHKLFLNGKPTSENFLDPAWAQYPKTCFYSTYDISGKVKQGANSFGAMLASGFYDTTGDRRVNGNNDKRPLTLILQAHIQYEDGTEDVVVSDHNWKWMEGPYTHTSILGGVDYDARVLPAEWSSPGESSGTWQAAEEMQPSHGTLTAAIAPPMRTYEEFKPKSISEPESGRYLYDFGQNASATPRLRVKGPSGARIRLTYSEQRHGSTPAHNNGKGLADQSGIRSPNYLDYTLRGGDEESWFADLYYSGYQYIELTGAVPEGYPNPDNKPVVSELVSVHVHTACDVVGTFACSDPMYERIDTMVDWSVRSNLAHVLTDCPHREKMGWLEVMHLMWPSMASRYDLSRFGPKVARDVNDSQGPDGMIPTVAPAYPVFQDGFHYTPEWGATGVLIPWYGYQWYGDKRVLSDNYECMRSFVDYMKRTSNDLVPRAGLGDWYDYGHGKDLGPSHFTPTDLTAMCIFGDCAQVVSRAAEVLGKPDDARSYAELAARIRESFNRHFTSSPGEYKNHGSPQTANAMALVTNQVEPQRQTAVVERIVDDMKQRGWQQTAGDVGFHYLVRALADWGRHDAIFAMLARAELGSYQFLVNAGWTSLPESWNAFRHYSMNHCMLGHIAEWFSQDLGGIKPVAGAPAFKQFQLCPVVDGPITSASATLQSPYGKITCDWKREEGVLTVKATVPVNTGAVLVLPAVAIESLLEGGKPVASVGDILIRHDNPGKVELNLGAGQYEFSMPAPQQKP